MLSEAFSRITSKALSFSDFAPYKYFVNGPKLLLSSLRCGSVCFTTLLHLRLSLKNRLLVSGNETLFVLVGLTTSCLEVQRLVDTGRKWFKVLGVREPSLIKSTT